VGRQESAIAATEENSYFPLVLQGDREIEVAIIVEISHYHLPRGARAARVVVDRLLELLGFRSCHGGKRTKCEAEQS
jgi:hypothetical protein